MGERPFGNAVALLDALRGVKPPVDTKVNTAISVLLRSLTERSIAPSYRRRTALMAGSSPYNDS